MKVLVCGGRDYAKRTLLNRVLTQIMPTCIVHGGASGADALADRWANDWGVPVHRYPPDWDQWGKAAGPIRNQEMLDKEKPDMVLAFPGGRGTADMVRRAEAAGIRVVRITDGDTAP